MSNISKFEITAYVVPFNEKQNYFFDDEPPYNSKVGSWVCEPFAIGLNCGVKLPLPASSVYEQLPNYIKVEAYDENENIYKTYYFYVNNANRRGNMTIELSLKMDVLNTFKSEFIGSLSPKTIIKRQHESRFDLEGYTPSYGDFSLPRVIDKISEGLQPKLYQRSGGDVPKSEFGNFYLIYKTSQELSETNLNNPVSCYLIADAEIRARDGSSGFYPWTGEHMPQAGYYYVMGDNLNIDVVDPHGLGDLNIRGASSNFVVLFWNGNDLKVYEMSGDLDNDEIGRIQPFPFRTFTPNENPDFKVKFNLAVNVRYSAGILTTSTTKALSFPFAFSSGIQDPLKSLSFEKLNRDDSRIMKIVKLPYPPTLITKNGDNYEIEGFDFIESQQMFKLRNISQTFSNSIFNDTITGAFYESVGIDADYADHDRYIIDSKIYHSDFYNYKLNYDNFSLLVPFENCENERTGSVSASVVFKPTNTINSKFLFRVTISGARWTYTADYENALLASRNNEVTLFNNDYLNYLRTGYNYDKKTKAVQDTSAAISSGLAIAGGVAAIAGGVSTSNPLAIGAGVATIAGAFTSGITGAINREISFSAKKADLMARASSVSGVDDIDLFDAYANNALRVSVWQPSPEISKYLDDLFFYYGYARNYSGVPSFTSRLHFNFVECDAVFISVSAFEEYAEEIRLKLAAGVTYFHRVNGQYDLPQAKENYEMDLLP